MNFYHAFNICDAIECMHETTYLLVNNFIIYDSKHNLSIYVRERNLEIIAIFPESKCENV